MKRLKNKMIYIVSSCILGENCRYDGKNSRDEKILKFLENKDIIPVCPEVMGGMKTPRIPCEIVNAKDFILGFEPKVENKDKVDCTFQFIKGVKAAIDLIESKAKMKNCKLSEMKAILKDKSPSCGSKFIYDGSFLGHLIEGSGIFASMLRKYNVEILSEYDFK